MTRAYNTATTQQNSGGAVTPFTVGKNKIINGDFTINQRGFTSNTSSGYNFDRWRMFNSGGTVTITPQTFTLGTAPVTGYEGSTFAQIVTSGQSATSDYGHFTQLIESVRILANQTATLSFWAKAGSGTPKVAFEFRQHYGTGGSPTASDLYYNGQVTLSTSWTRYSITFNVPSIAGKTIGTDVNSSYLGVNLWVSAGSDYNARTGSLGIQSNTFQFWGMQLEAGSVATPFQTATGTIQGELAACQRYYYKHIASENVAVAFASGTAIAQTALNFPVTMRIAPTITLPASGSSTGQIAFLNSSANYPATIGTLAANRISVSAFTISTTSATSAFTAGNASVLFVTGTTQTAYEASAEL
jgi:hypothetical protein